MGKVPWKVASCFPEFLGPNRKVARVPGLAVIGLGTLKVTGVR